MDLALSQALYGNDASARKAYDLERQAALEKVIPDATVHDTIMRAWNLLQRNQRNKHSREMQARYDCMQSALTKLEQVSPSLFKLATGGPKFSNVRGTAGDAGQRASREGRIPGLFPRQMPVIR